MYCPNCGAKVSDTARFCGNCGTELEIRVIESFTQAVALAQTGDENGFTYLYEETYKSKYYLALKYMDSKEAAEDVVQDAYIKAFSKLDTLKDPETFSAWLGTIVANTAKNALQKKNPMLFSDLPSGDEDADLPDFDVEDESIDTQPEEAYTRQETAELVREMISSLSEEQKMCILMYHIDGESIHDIAEALDCSENTVKSRLNYGRKNLKAKAEELQKKGYKLFTLAPIPLLLFLLREDADAMTVEQSFLAAGKQIEGVILQHIPSLAREAAQAGAQAAAQAGGKMAAQTGVKAAAGAASHGFFATTAGKVVIGVIIAGAVAGGVGGGLAVRHNNQVNLAKEEAEKAAEEEARRNELIAEAEAGAAAEAEAAEAAETEIEEPEETVEEEEEVAIPVTDNMYPELLEGGLTKDEFQYVLAYGLEEYPGENLSYEVTMNILDYLIMGWYNGAPMFERELDEQYRSGYDLSKINRMFSVFTNTQINENTSQAIEVIGDTFWMFPADLSWSSEATIKEANYTDDEMKVLYHFHKEQEDMSNGNIEITDTDKTAILRKDENDKFRVVDIVNGNLMDNSNQVNTVSSDQEYILPGSDSTYLSRSDLTGLSSDELRLARNELYARHGRKFNDAALQEYFNSKDWYNGTIDPDDFSESMLNEYEVANRDLIIAYEAEVESGTSTSSASSDSADTNVTGSIREIYEQVLKDVQAGKYTFIPSGYDLTDYEDMGYQYFVTDMNGDGIKELIVAKHYFDTVDVGWTSLEDDRYARVFTVTQNGNAYSLKVIDGITNFVDAYYAEDGNKGFYAQNYLNRGNGEMSVSLITISSNALSEGTAVKYTPGESGYSQFGTTNPNVTWYDISDLSGLNGI